ncbi:MAG: NADH dehydrogenase [Elusimicrobia bacterium]|nr:NADH dehydrogenase [Elusimicrobiota bacterium]
MEILKLTIYIPLVLGFLALFVPGRFFRFNGIFALISSAAVLVGGMKVYPSYSFSVMNTLALKGDILSAALVMLTGLFGFLVALYTIGHTKEGSGFFWFLYCWLLSASAGVFLADHYIVMLVSWGVTGLVLALMIWNAGNEEIGKKTFLLVGGSDALMIMGLAGLVLAGHGSSLGSVKIGLASGASWMIFTALAIAAFTKAGAMPFHTWIPDTSKLAPIPVVAILPASIDKLLGIYLLKRIVMDWFVITAGGNLIMMLVGAVTVIAAVFMALAQHNLRRLLGYHAVSQVGYMVMGLGTGTVVGIAGGLMHMINNAIYKQGLFLCSGVIESRTGTSRLEDLGGLFKKFPITFASFTICAMAISGVPPLNGFVSKWMIYQGIIKTSITGNPLWVIWLVSAVFGSALTLASFIKIVHAAFLGQSSKGGTAKSENVLFEVPALVILPAMCILIGIFPHYTVYPLLEQVLGPIHMNGLWFPQIAASFLLIGVGVGVLVYALCRVSGFRYSETYIGGEKVTPAMRVSGVEFYTTIENLGFFKKVYSWAGKGYFDMYEILKGFVFYWIKLLRWLHNGILSTYILWVMVGSVIVFYVFLK